MDVNIVVGFLLGLFMTMFITAAFWMILGLGVSVIRTFGKNDSGIKILTYAIEATIPLGLVIALGWLMGQITYSSIAFWFAVSLGMFANTLLLLKITPNGMMIGLIWKWLRGS
jgi:hypothetical protein